MMTNDGRHIEQYAISAFFLSARGVFAQSCLAAVRKYEV
jgi:hypothetical protein